MEYNDTIHNENRACVLPFLITDNQWTFYDNISWWLEGLGSIIIGSLGIIFNITTIIVVLGSDLAASFFNWLLVCLALFDSLFLLTGILEAFRNHVGSSYVHDYVFVMFLYPFRSVAMCCSIYMTITLAVERHNALITPVACHRRGSICPANRTLNNYFKTHWKRVIKYVGPIVIFAILFYLPKFFELRLVRYATGSSNATGNHYEYIHEVQLSELRKNNQYILWYLNVTNLLITAAIPLIALAYLNFNICSQLKTYVKRQPSVRKSVAENFNSDAKKKIQRKEKDVIAQTIVLFTIVVLFVLFHTLRIVLNIEELVTLNNVAGDKEQGCTWLQYWTLVAVPISHILLSLNSSMNLFIYCFCNRSFRNVLRSKLDGISYLCKRNEIVSPELEHEMQETNRLINNDQL